ncbi:MAG: hypothetical protein WCS33_03720, partial [Candidatus Caldatribacteriota bacterium]
MFLFLNSRRNIATVFLFILFLVVNLNIFCPSIRGQESDKTVLAEQIPVYIADFFEPGCLDCEKAARLLEQIAFQYPQVEIKKFDISTPSGVTTAEQLGEIYGVPEYARLVVPIIYIGDSYFLREHINYDNLLNLVEQIK